MSGVNAATSINAANAAVSYRGNTTNPIERQETVQNIRFGKKAGRDEFNSDLVEQLYASGKLDVKPNKEDATGGDIENTVSEAASDSSSTKMAQFLGLTLAR